MEISLDRVLKVVWKQKILVIVVAVIFAVGAYIFTDLTVPPTYTSHIGFTVVSTASETNISNPSYLNSNLSYTRSIVSSKVALLETYDYYEMVASQFNSSIDELIAQHPDQKQMLESYKRNASQIGRTVSFNIIDGTELFTINVRTGSKAESKMIADAIKKTANVRLSQLSRPENALAGETYVADTVRCYEAPREGSYAGPYPLRNAVLGFLVGLFLIVAVIAIVDAKDTRVKSITEFKERYNTIPILGTVPSFIEVPNK